MAAMAVDRRMPYSEYSYISLYPPMNFSQRAGLAASCAGVSLFSFRN